MHLTYKTNAEVMQQAGLQLPSLKLVSLLTREGHRKQSTLDEHVCSPASSWWSTVMQSLSYKPESSQLISVQMPAQPQTCPECGISYNTRAALLTHMAKHHPEKAAAAPPEPYHKTLDSLGGLPQCSHCKKKFSTWQLLQRHVEGNYCSVRHSFLPQPLTTSQQPEQSVLPVPPVFSDNSIQQLLHKYAANAVFHIPNRQRYKQHCLVCGQWVASSRVMKLHYVHHIQVAVVRACTAIHQ